MENNVKEMLPRFYALRAGLSALSMEKDKSDTLSHRIEASNRNIVQFHARVADRKKTHPKADEKNKKQQEIANVRKKLEIDLKRAQNDKETSKEDRKDYARNVKFVVIGILLIIVSILGFFIEFIGYFAGTAGLVGLILLIKGAYRIRKGAKDAKISAQTIKNYPQKVAALRSQANTQITRLENEIRTLDAEIHLENEQIQRDVERMQAEHKAEGEKTQSMILKRKEIVVSAKQFYDALVTEFSPLLDVRDWQNLDLVVYYLETGRADSLKEALQLADRQHQTDAIVQTMEMARDTICNTIQRSIYGLAKVVALSAQSIQSAIDRQTITLQRSQESLISAIGSSQAKLSAQIGQLTEAQNLQNALTAKATVTSERLANDVHYLRSEYDRSLRS